MPQIIDVIAEQRVFVKQEQFSADQVDITYQGNTVVVRRWTPEPMDTIYPGQLSVSITNEGPLNPIKAVISGSFFTDPEPSPTCAYFSEFGAVEDVNIETQYIGGLESLGNYDGTGTVFFSDLEILFVPVYGDTIFRDGVTPETQENVVFIQPGLLFGAVAFYDLQLTLTKFELHVGGDSTPRFWRGNVFTREVDL